MIGAIASHYVASATSPYVAAVLTDAPQHYWRLGEAAGDAADLGSNPITATYGSTGTRGMPGALAGDADLAYRSNGTLTSRIITTTTGNSQGATFSIEAWVKVAAGSNPDLAGIVGRWGGGDALQKWWLVLEGGKPSFFVHHAVAGYPQLLATDIRDDTWHHIVAQRKPGEMKLYVDAVLKHTLTPADGAFYGEGDVIAVAGHTSPPSGGSYLTGQVDEVAVYTTYLSAARVLAHYNAGIGA